MNRATAATAAAWQHPFRDVDAKTLKAAIDRMAEDDAFPTIAGIKSALRHIAEERRIASPPPMIDYRDIPPDVWDRIKNGLDNFFASLDEPKTKRGSVTDTKRRRDEALRRLKGEK